MREERKQERGRVRVLRERGERLVKSKESGAKARGGRLTPAA